MENNDHSEVQNEVLSISSIQNKYKKLTIPGLQRDYVWGTIQWERLWKDILAVYNAQKENTEPDAQLFLGNITLKEASGDCEVCEVIDGQQRLTTITVLLDMLLDLKAYHNQSNTNRKKSYFDIGNCKAAREEKVIENDGGDDKKPYSRVYNFFSEKYAESLSNDDVDDIISVIENRVFVYAEVRDKSSLANDDFERLNATGEPLVYTDLILNHLISMGEKEGKALSDIKDNWTKILSAISDQELPPQYVGDTDDEEEELDEPADEQPEDTAEDQQTEAVSAEVQSVELKLLKIKKFFNALNSVTLPKRETFSESVDDFIRIFERLRNSFYENETFNVDFILNAMRKWAWYYIEYIDPFYRTQEERKNNNEKAVKREDYILDLYYLRTIGNTSLIPAVMRTLFRVNNNKLDTKDAANIFHALVSAQLLRAAYTDRDNSTNMDNKFRIVDHIYMAIGETDRPYDSLMSYLTDKDYNNDLNKDNNQITSQKYDFVRLWNMPYSSGLSKAILAIGYDMQRGKKDWLFVHDYEMPEINKEPTSVRLGIIKNKMTKEELRFQVEHMVPRALSEGRYEDYGYDNNTVNSFWNLELLESWLNKEASNKPPTEKLKYWGQSCFNKKFPMWLNSGRTTDDLKKSRADLLKEMKISQVTRLIEMFDGFYEYCKYCSLKEASEEASEKTNGGLKVVSYHKNDLGEYEKITKYIEPNNDGKICSVSIEGSKYTVKPELKNGNNAITAFYFIDDKGNHIDTKTDKTEALKYLLWLFAKQKNNTLAEFTLDSSIIKVLEEISCKIGEGKDNIKVSNVLFVNADDIKKIQGDSNKYRIIKDQQNITINSYTYYINNNTDAKAFSGAARLLFEKLAKNRITIPFALAVEMTRPELHYIGGSRRLTPFRFLGGNQKAFKKFWENRQQKKNVATQSAGRKKPVKAVKNNTNINLYMTAESMKFCELREKMCEKLVIPYYQRAYVWDKPQFEALLDSINNKRPLGTIILYEKVDDKDVTYHVVDGQQRLTTMEALYQVLTPSDCIFKKDEDKPDSKAQRAIVYFKNISDKKTLEQKIESAQFNVLTISKDAPETFQYKVFGTINGCGIRLTVEDKVKNYLYMTAQGQNIDKKCWSQDFIKAYTEMKCGEHIAESALYARFKANFPDRTTSKISDLCTCANLFDELKKANAKKWQGERIELGLWLKMYRLLGVNTADALLLHVFSDESKENTDFMRHLIMLFFLLYVDDPNGNSKKSINGKLPKIIKESNCDEALLEKIWGTGDCKFVLDDQYPTTYKSDNHGAYRYIFDKLCSFDLVGDTKKNVARFILLLSELWCGLDIGTAIDELDSKLDININGKNTNKPSEIEHIFPANPSNSLKLPDGFEKPIFINQLMNVCLLESGINKTVGNKMLKQQDKCGKLFYYKNSRFITPYMLSACSSLCDTDGRYGNEQAEARIMCLFEMFNKKLNTPINFVDMLNDVSKKINDTGSPV